MITVGVFLFMQSLIQRNKEEVVQVPLIEEVRILREEPDQEEPEPEQEMPDQAPPEPTMDALAVDQVTPPAPVPAG